MRLTIALSRSQALCVVALSLSYAVSLLIFQRGLLIKRQVLPNRSACTDTQADQNEHCWIRPRFKRAILLVVDALRYDFISPKRNREDCKNTASHYFIGQMQRVATLLREEPRNSGLYIFLADAPTTTFQRIKALVTGTVPAFIEAGENFGGQEITEDNIVDQLLAKGHNITLLGDETWLQLLPGRFHRHFEEPSFDIKDLDTVDNTVIAHIFDEMARPEWTLLIAHCLGVDHAGHRYGTLHPEMTRKLRQMDHLIWNLTQQLADDTILLVLGDHGMTANGDHGGDSQIERMSALFAYARHLDVVQRPFNASNVLQYDQVDLVPTLALLLDVPIPYSNIGRLIGPLFGANCLHETRLNTLQMMRYALDYARLQPELMTKLRQIIRQHEGAPDDFPSNQNSILALQKLVRASLDQFNISICLIGLLSLLEAILFNCFLLLSGADEWLTICLWVFRSALLLLQLSLVSVHSPTSDVIAFSTASVSVSLCYLAMVLSYNGLRSFGVHRQHGGAAGLPRPEFVLGFAQIVLSLLPLSNSYIVYESDVLRFVTLSTTFVLVGCDLHAHRWPNSTNILRVPQKLKKVLFSAVVFVLSLRTLKQFESCREEQVECVPTQTVRNSDGMLACSIMASFVTSYFLLEDCHNASYGRKLFIAALNVVLGFHWLFEYSAHSIKGAAGHTTTTTTSDIDVTVARLELVGLCLADVVYAAVLLDQLFLHSRYYRKGVRHWIDYQLQVVAIALVMLAGQLYSLQMAVVVILFEIAWLFTEDKSACTLAFVLHLLGSCAFYATGHQKTLNSIPWGAAFVGVPGNFPYKWLPGLLVLANLFSGKVLASLVALRQWESKAPLYLLLFGGIKVFGSSLAGLVHHRHLMFYKVFAPNFVFDSVGQLFCCAFVVMWMVLRVQEKPHQS